MSKREKSKKIYALRLIDKAEIRDKFLSELLDSSYQPEPIGVPQYLCGSITSFGFTNHLEYTKTWKTIHGVEKFKSNLIELFNNNPTKFIDLPEFDIDKYMEQGIIWATGSSNVPYSSISVDIVEVTDMWNQDIDKRIERENQRHDRELRKLNALKVT